MVNRPESTGTAADGKGRALWPDPRETTKVTKITKIFYMLTFVIFVSS
jgi:hypothetical protein